MNKDIFNRNITFLEGNHPTLARKLCKLTPEKVLHQSDTNDLLLDGMPFYGQDAETATQQQVSMFFSKPSHFSLKLQNKNRKIIHQRIINRLNEQADSLGYQQNGKPEFTNLVLLGAGLGYQIEQLNNLLTFHNVVLVEPNDEMLFYFLHFIDLHSLHNKLQENGGSFYILQPGTKDDFHNKFQRLLQSQTGYGFLAEVTIFRHYETPLFTHALENFKAIRQHLLSGFGFFEDEITGIKHSFNNLNRHPYFTESAATDAPKTPVVIVGNGPSLDQNIRRLKEIADKVIVVSCGTAIAPLLNSGIVPDIHVEMERAVSTAQIQEKWLEQDVLKDTFFIGLATVSQQITDQFSHSLLFTKANDTGWYLLNDCFGHLFPPLYFSNPTVTNFALAAIIQLRFENITLLGCDYGFRDSKQHHSKSSDYFNSGNKRIGFNPAQTLQVEDNFGGQITASRIFNEARLNVEKLLSQHPKLQVINSSDGAKIKHTRWQSFDSISFNNLGETVPPVFRQLRLDASKLQVPDLSQKLLQLEVTEKLFSALRILQTLPSKKISVLEQIQKLSLDMDETLENDLSAVLFVGDARYYHLLISSHFYRLKAANLKTYWQTVSKEMDSALEAYKALILKLNMETTNDNEI